MKKQRDISIVVISGIFALLVSLVVSFFVGVMYTKDSGSHSVVIEGDNNIDSSAYYAVFLTNNQVYFGHIVKTSKETMTMTDVFYLTSPGGSTISIKDVKDAALAKLTERIHQPENASTVNTSQVIVYEKLKPDSQVVMAIQDAMQGVQDASDTH